MPEYLLPCSCGQKVRVATAQAGGVVGCTCGQSLAVPTLRGLKALEVAPSRQPGPAAAGWSATHGALFASGLVGIGLGLAIAAFCLLRYVQITSSGYAKDRTADVVTASNQNIDAMTPVQTLEVWQKEMLEEGLGDVHPPIWVVAQERINYYLWWAKFAAGLIAAGAVLGIATLFVGRPAR
jgi:hypothetical protein